MIVTERVRLMRFTQEDAPFILELLNDPDWIRFIGDRSVRTLDDARRYLANGPIRWIERHGHGLMRVSLK